MRFILTIFCRITQNTNDQNRGRCVGQFACNKSGKLVTGKTQPKVGDQIDTGEYSNRVKVSGDNPKMVHPKTGNYLQKDRAKNSGAGTHGTSENKLFNKKGDRIGTVDKDGNITRD